MKETGLEKERKEETMNKPIQKWQKPVDGFVKINSDGAFSANTGGGGGWGYVICAGAGGQLSHLKDAFQAEICACMQGAKAAADHGMGRVVLETSASLVLSIAMKNDSYRRVVLF